MDYLPPARAIFLSGFMGTGKTTNGRRLAERLGLDFVDTDELVEALAEKPIAEIFAESGEETFRELETEALRRAVNGPRAVVSTGGGIMLRPENLELMRSAGPIICLEASPQTILRRTSHKPTRPLLQSDDPVETITSLLRQRQTTYDKADYKVRADSEDRRIVLAEIRDVLARDPRSALLVHPHARVPVKADRDEYRIHIERGAFASLASLCPPPATGVRCAVITSDIVGPLYGEQVVAALRDGGWEAESIEVPDGESSKSLEVAASLYDRLVEMGVDSGGAVFALGGGVVGDLAGFVAATYRRGIRLAQLPTTLLGQVDASIGGKVAVNHPRGKNLIGAFHQPAGVVIDTATLESLPEREVRSGLAEIIKHAAIADAALFEFLEAELAAFVRLDELTVRYVLARNCQIKAQVVEEDPYDKGARACLNYGHTIGHAIERAAGEWDLRHGEAVAIGIVAEARLALELGVCEEATVERQVALVEAAGLPTSAPRIDIERALRGLEQDKKIAAGRLRLPVVPDIGTVRVLSDVAPELLHNALRKVVGGNG